MVKSLQLDELLLEAWLQLCTVINNDRIVQTMSFNEAFVCHLLNQQQNCCPLSYLTATDLCNKTGLFKSQMNTILTSLEQKNIIYRIRSTSDKRKIYIILLEDGMGLYQKEHAHILAFINQIISLVGEEEIKKFIQILDKITSCAKEAIKKRGLYGN